MNPDQAGGTRKLTPIRAPRIPRGRRVIAAVIVAALLLITAVYASVQAIYLYINGAAWLLDAPSVAARLHGTSWQDPAVTTGSAVLTAAGVWLLILALTPAGKTMTELTEPDGSMSAGITPTGLRRTLRAAAERVDGVSTADVRLVRGVAATTVTTPLRHHEALPTSVTSAVNHRLGQLNPVRGYTVRVRVQRKDAR